MTWYQLAGDWRQFTVMVKQRWDRLTDADLTTFGGGRGPARRIAAAEIRLHSRASRTRNR